MESLQSFSFLRQFFQVHLMSKRWQSPRKLSLGPLKKVDEKRISWYLSIYCLNDCQIAKLTMRKLSICQFQHISIITASSTESNTCFPFLRQFFQVHLMSKRWQSPRKLFLGPLKKVDEKRMLVSLNLLS